jgi:cell shape-determining protein MreD
MLLSNKFSIYLAIILTSLALVFASYTPSKIFALSLFMPSIELIIIFFFYAYQKKLSYWFILLLALLSDSFNGYTIGVSALSYFLALLLFKKEERLFFYHSFREIWFSFMIFTIQFLLIKWLILSLTNVEFYHIYKILPELLLTIITYPLFHAFFSLLFANALKNIGHE